MLNKEQADRFWSSVLKSSDKDGCWTWQRDKKSVYGRFYFNKMALRAQVVGGGGGTMIHDPHDWRDLAIRRAQAMRGLQNMPIAPRPVESWWASVGAVAIVVAIVALMVWL